MQHLQLKIKENFNFEINHIGKKEYQKLNFNEYTNYLIVTTNISKKISNCLVIDSLPLQINKIVEKINLSFLKNQFNNQLSDEIVEMSRMEKLISDHMLDSKDKSAHVQAFIEAEFRCLKIRRFVSMFRCKLLDYRSFYKSYIVFVCRNNEASLLTLPLSVK